ncbi:MAG: putative cytokinetic ring protein SteA [Bacillota bacterium]
MDIIGRARVDRKTKVLVRRIKQGEIAVIDHPELDGLAASALVKARVKAVINASPSISERYPNDGPLVLVSNGIMLIDDAGKEIMDRVRDGQTVKITDGRIMVAGRLIASGKILAEDEIIRKMDRLKKNMHVLLSDFVINTLEYARNEIDLINGNYEVPDIKTVLRGRHVLIVVRGHSYKEDLEAIRSYIDEKKPLLIGVDGGADALMEAGYRPDVIVGDMDSVSDKALFSGAEIVVHAYKDGSSPGKERISRLGLTSAVFTAPGTSEDIAMLLAYEKGAELIVMLGSHSNAHDFLEKGRKGMASTFLVRHKVGPVLVDAKGVSKLYRNRIKAGQLGGIVLAALVPAVMVIVLSPQMRQIIRLIYLQFRFLLGV